MALQRYRIVGICDNNALVVEICSNYRYAVFQARQLLRECETVTVFQDRRRVKTLIR